MRPDPGQYEGMHADVRFPAHERGTLFDAPPVEPLLAPPDRSLANIVTAFLSPPPAPAACQRLSPSKLPSMIPAGGKTSRVRAGVVPSGAGRVPVERVRQLGGKLKGNSAATPSDGKPSGEQFQCRIATC